VDEAHLKSILESLLFAAGEPVSLARLAAVFDDLPRATVNKTLTAMAAEYAAANRGIVIEEVAGGFQMRTSKDHAAYVRKLLASKPPRLSRPLMETVAIIAYRQPITRPEIEQFARRRYRRRARDSPRAPDDQNCRPQGSSGAARWSMPPTDEFLEIFGLKDLESLPDLSEFREIERSIEQANTGPVAGVETHPEDSAPVDPALADELGEEPPCPNPSATPHPPTTTKLPADT